MDDIPPSTHCVRGELMDNFGILIQGILGMIAFSTLMLKRLREPKKHRRPWTIWFFDTSKQGFGALFIHFANVFLADALSVDDPCTWYLISFLLDSTIGLLLIYLGLKFTQCIVRYYQCSSLYFGEYGDPPRCNAWLGQVALYLIVMIIEKALVGLMVIPSFWYDVRKYMLSWIKDPHVEVILVMLVIPFLVNTIMFWVVDNFLMRKTKRFYGSAIRVTDVYKSVPDGSKKTLAITEKGSKLSLYRSDSSEDDAKLPKKSSLVVTGVRYHKMSPHANLDDKRTVNKGNDRKNSEETLLLLQDDSEVQNDTEDRVHSTRALRKSSAEGKTEYYRGNSQDCDSDNSASGAGNKKYTLLTNNVKRL